MEFVRASLAGRTTLGVGGEAVIAECENEDEVKAAVAHARDCGLPFAMLGEGSNTLAADEGYAGIVIHPTMRAVSWDEDADARASTHAEGSARPDSNGVLLIAEAGAHWDGLVSAAAERGLWGIENLAGIPGSVGAAPVQNIGAYGAELADTLRWVECIDTADSALALRRFDRAACGFAYRESRFKRERGLIIVRAAFALSRNAPGSARKRAEYPDLEKARAAGARLETPADIATAVRAIRAAKFPKLEWEQGAWLLAEGGTAGSFFKNPVIPGDAYEALRMRYPGLPGYRAAGLAREPRHGASGASDADSGVKIPLAYVLDKVLSLRGYRLGAARLYESQPLVLVADRGAQARDVDALADDVAKKVFDATGIAIEREVQSLK